MSILKAGDNGRQGKTVGPSALAADQDGAAAPVHVVQGEARCLEGSQAQLVEELGTEPGAGLRELHQQILTGDPVLSAPQHAVAKGRAAAVVPRELPGPVAGFVGRGQELASLTGLLDRFAEGMPPAVVISAIGGTAGVGKTKPRANTSNRYRRAA